VLHSVNARQKSCTKGNGPLAVINLRLFGLALALALALKSMAIVA
jgi:hypothetical protein